MVLPSVAVLVVALRVTIDLVGLRKTSENPLASFAMRLEAPLSKTTNPPSRLRLTVWAAALLLPVPVILLLIRPGPGVVALLTYTSAFASASRVERFVAVLMKATVWPSPLMTTLLDVPLLAVPATWLIKVVLFVVTLRTKTSDLALVSVATLKSLAELVKAIELPSALRLTPVNPDCCPDCPDAAFPAAVPAAFALTRDTTPAA